MTIALAEFLETTQAPRSFGPGRSVDWILENGGGSGTHATLAWDAETGSISGGVREMGAEEPVIHFEATLVAVDELDVRGTDDTGETSSPGDPRGILSGFRRQIRMMQSTGRCRLLES